MNAVIEQRKVLLEIADLKVHFDIKEGKQWFWQPPKTLKAVDGVTLRLYEGETLGVVGESGCGKSTFARAIIGLVKATDGKVAWLGKDLLGMKADEWREVRSDIQMIFQDPLASLNPRMTIGEIIAEPLRTYHPKLSRQDVRDRVKAMMLKVGLLPNLINRYPHEFSGGQCQRIGIARALILEPKLIICDEPVSALDVSIQAQVVNLLQQLQREALPISPENVEAAEARNRICCCSGVIFCTSSNRPALPARCSPSLSCAICASLGEKA